MAGPVDVMHMEPEDVRIPSRLANADASESKQERSFILFLQPSSFFIFAFAFAFRSNLLSSPTLFSPRCLYTFCLALSSNSLTQIPHKT